MLARGHRLKIGEVGLVGYATQTGEPRLALDVGQDAVHFKNPLLPETRSEVVLPLKVRDQVIGALDVQSREEAAFDEESLAILQVMADQLAIAIQNALLLQEARQHLSELETAYGRFDRQGWQRYIQTNAIGGYQYDGMATQPIYSDEGSLQDIGANGEGAVSIPLKVRDQMIGTIDIWPREGALSDEENYLLTNLSNRISQVMESARLYEEAQERAAREETINWIATQVRSSVNMETILQNTVRELGRALGASRTFIRIGAERSSAERSLAATELADPADGDGHRTEGGSDQGAVSL
jgi:transcriptional regulator with GAF, ATPase, and Fis domain